MNTDHWLIILVIVVSAFFIPYAHETSIVDKSQTESITAERDVLAACQAAIGAADLQKDQAFGTDALREKAIELFYAVYDDNFNYLSQSAREGAKYHVPCILLVDWDGYYISYVTPYKSGKSTLYEQNLTEINTWSYAYGSYIVMYRLDDNVTIYTSNGTYSGSYDSAYEQAVKANGGHEIPELSFLTNEASFSEERSLVVISEIEDTVQYYVDTHNDYYNTYGASYKIVFPTTENSLSGFLDHPSVISFSQHEQKQTSYKYVNIYTLVASDACEEKIYYINDSNGNMTYHTAGCAALTFVSGSGTQEECAKMGAYPDTCVY